LQGGTQWQSVTLFVEIVGLIELGHQSQHRCHRVVEAQAKRTIHRGESVIPWIEWTGRACNPDRIEPLRVGDAERKRIQIAGARIADKPQIRTKLDGVLPLRPRDVIDEIVDGCGKGTGVIESERRKVRRAVVIQPAKFNDGTRGISGVAETLPRIAPAEIVE